MKGAVLLHKVKYSTPIGRYSDFNEMRFIHFTERLLSLIMKSIDISAYKLDLDIESKSCTAQSPPRRSWPSNTLLYKM